MKAHSGAGSDAQTVVIVGGSSAIGRALAHELATAGRTLVLTGRDAAGIEDDAADVRLRSGRPVTARHIPACQPQAHAAAIAAILDEIGDALAGVVVCIGDSGAALDATEECALIDTNLTTTAAVLGVAATRIEARGHGFLCALSSVAGDRGRRSNYVYGAAKAGLNVYMQGLRHRLAGSAVRVITVKLGPVDTRLSYGTPAASLAIAPAAAARAIHRAIEKRNGTIYVPRRWRWIMAAIRSTPDWLFNRLPID